MKPIGKNQGWLDEIEWQTAGTTDPSKVARALAKNLFTIDELKKNLLGSANPEGKKKTNTRKPFDKTDPRPPMF